MKQTTPEQMIIQIVFVAGGLLAMFLLGLFFVQEGRNGIEIAMGCLLLAFTVVALYTLGWRGFRFFFPKSKSKK